MDELINKLEKLDQSSIKEGVSSHFIEILKNDSETVFSANREGLIWLALEALKLAKNCETGSHVHIDEQGIADKAETNFVLAYKKEKWN